WVTLSDEDFEKVQIESTHSVEITDFVDQAQINPKFFYKPYFLEPQKGGEKAYALLHKALTTAGKLGVAKVAIQKREYLAAATPVTPRVQPNVIDMVAVLQQSLQRASQKKRPSPGRSTAKKATSTLVKQKRRSVAA